MSHRRLSAHNIGFAYQDGAAPLVHASIDIAPRSRVALLGANGSGKTTLLRILAGSLKPSTGVVYVDSHPLRYRRKALRVHRENVQLVLQNPDDQLFSADVEHDVAFGPVNLGLSNDDVGERVGEALSLLGLTSLARTPIHMLSYGQRKRVAIAGAVAMRPCILLLDEPTAGLDPAGVEEMLTALERLEDNDTTVAISTHDTALALEWADTVSIVHGGQIRQGDPYDMLSDRVLLRDARLRTPWAIDLTQRLAARNLLPADVRPHSMEEVVANVADAWKIR